MFFLLLYSAKATNHNAENPYCTHIEIIVRKAVPWTKPMVKNNDTGRIIMPNTDTSGIPPISGCVLILPSYSGRLKYGSPSAASDWNIISMPQRPISDVVTDRNAPYPAA